MFTKQPPPAPKDRAIMYVGKTPTRRDNLCRTGLKWDKVGAIHLVDGDVAATLTKYPDVWAEVDKDGNLLEDQYLSRCDAAKLTPVLLANKPAKKEAKKQEADPDLTPGEVPEDILKIVEVIKGLEPKDFGKNKKPKIAAVRAALDESVTNEELNAAWKVING